ncbi:hypothetical protein PENSPDRAFT_137556 [Peniophora sp. CONT]|nr:hypothetical protein PENSPDRAFT_137556 [Peniophora sp. CONT]
MRMDTVTQWLSRIFTSSFESVAFRPVKQAWHNIGSFSYFTSISLPSGMNVVSTRRRRPRDVWHDMSVAQFKFVWPHTSRQLIDAGASSFETLLQSTLEILRSIKTWNGTRSECLDHLLSDRYLASRLDDIGRLRWSLDSDTRVATLELTCLLLRRSYTKPEAWIPYSEDYGITILSCLSALIFMIRDPQNAEVNTHASLPLRLCLFNLRWSLLLLVHNIPDGSGLASFDALTFDEVYFTKDRLDDLMLLLASDHVLLEKPKALLSLVNSWQYNALDANGRRSSHADWTTDASSCMVPLHDAACCKRRDGPLEHVAACTVLTMVAHLLRAPEQDRDALLEGHLRQSSKLWDHELALGDLDRDFKMSVEDRRRVPSPEFLAVLRDAGLNDWLKPDSDFTCLPPKETPLGRFLAHEIGFRQDEAGYFAPFTTATVLRSLARRVDMSALHSQTLRNTVSISAARAMALPTGPTQLALVAEDSTSLRSGTANTAEVISADAADTSDRQGSFDLAHVVVDSASDAPYLKPVEHGSADGTNAARGVLNSRSDDSNSQSTTGGGQGISLEVGDEAVGQKKVSTPLEPQQERAEKDGTLPDLGKTGDSDAIAEFGGRLEREGAGA